MPRNRTQIRKQVERDLAPVRRHAQDLLQAGKAEQAVDTLLSLLSDALTEHTTQVAGRTSERVSEDQLKLLLEKVPEDAPTGDESDALTESDLTPEPAPPPEDKPKRKHTPHGRRPLPDALPREPVEVRVSDEDRRCENCGGTCKTIGSEASEVLELVPAHFKVIRYEREKVACPQCRDGVTTAPMPDRLYDRVLAGPGLLSHVAVSKFADHVPLNRLRGLFLRLGVDIGTQTLSAWVLRVASELAPIVDHMWACRAKAHFVHTDATGLRVLDHDHEDGVRLGTLWGYCIERRYAVFRYAATAAGATGPWRHLADYNGNIVADAANVFDRLYNGKVAKATEVACNAHARRRFFKLLEVEPEAAKAIEYYQRLYDVERAARDEGLDPDALGRRRLRDSKPILDAYRQWLARMQKRHPPKSTMGQAVAYVLRHWQALTRFLHDGRLPLDNNLMELQLRFAVVGRKNWLFAGSDEGAIAAATMLSIVRSCALNGVNPVAYVQDVLVKLVNLWPKDRIDELLPDRWAQQHKEQAKADAA